MQANDPPRGAPRSEPPPGAAPADDVERAHRTCPICGGELAERKCKLYCPRPGCGYFLSCADYY
jgi:ribosomal protein S27AE